MERYTDIERIGEGAFGVVEKGRRKRDGCVVALKKVFLRHHDKLEAFPNGPLREWKSLEHLDHPNIISLLEVFPEGAGLVLVFEFATSDLAKVLRWAAEPLKQAQIKGFLVQILQGLANCHECHIIHRDIKPANLLLTADGTLKLADFGQARVFECGTDGPYSHQVGTRWYRAPELLYGARNYTESVDIWSVGCTFAEMLHGSPLFPGDNDIDQLHRVIQIMGTPHISDWPDLVNYPDFGKVTFEETPPVPLEEILPNAPVSAMDLLKRMLVYNPSRRVTAKEALLHRYFFEDPLPCHPSELPLASKPKDDGWASMINPTLP